MCEHVKENKKKIRKGNVMVCKGVLATLSFEIKERKVEVSMLA